MSIAISASVEAGRKAWEAGDVDAYMEFYATKARQQGKGKAAIAEHKRRIWASAPPQTVQLSGLRVNLDSQGVRVAMMQVYRDKNDKGDKGIKTLLMQTETHTWRIVQEDWSDCPAKAQGR